MDATTLLHNIRNAIHDNSDTQTWCTAQYTRNHKVYVGIDKRNPPADSEYPLVVLLPINKVAGQELEAQEHGIGVVCGLINEDLATTGKDNAVEYQGMEHIETFRKYVETAIAGIITSPQWIEEINIEYEPLEYFPHFMAAMEIRISDEYYQGDDTWK